MNNKQLAKEIFRKHFEIGAVLVDEALQSAIITAEYIGNDDLMNEIKLMASAEFERSKNTALAKYWISKPIESINNQLQLF
jgi:hypothetical protein